MRSSVSVRRLTEGGILLAIGFVLSFISVLRLPYGGEVTAACMFPIILCSYRLGVGRGLTVGFAFSLLQLLLGMNNLSYATSAAAAAAIVLLDYVVAYTAVGLGGIFRRVFRVQSTALLCGTLLVCLMRYLCHVVAGCTVWAGVSVPTEQGLIFSLCYNASYMLPETAITAGVAWYLGAVLDFREECPKRLRRGKGAVWQAAALLIGVAAVVTGAVLLSRDLQTENGFDITRITAANLPLIGGILLGGAVIAALLWGIGHHFAKEEYRDPSVLR